MLARDFEVNFKNEEHEKSFLSMYEKHGSPSLTHRSKISALYLLSRLNRSGVWDFVGKNKIIVDELRKEAKTWSDEEIAIVKLAIHLYDAKTPCQLDEVLSVLDHNDLPVALEGIRIKYDYMNKISPVIK